MKGISSPKNAYQSGKSSAGLINLIDQNPQKFEKFKSVFIKKTN